MEQLIESLKSVFDKKTASCLCSQSSWVVEEKDDGATFRRVTFQKKDLKFGIVTNDFYKSVGKIISDRSKFLLDKDCDGVSFYVGQDGVHMILVDLKSSFNEENIYDAYKQDYFSMLKLHMMLSLCQGYDITKMHVDCYVACPPCKNIDEESEIMDNILAKEEIGEERFIDKCLKCYFFDKSGYNVQLCDVPFTSDKLLNEDLMRVNMRFNIYTPESYNASEGVVSDI